MFGKLSPLLPQKLLSQLLLQKPFLTMVPLWWVILDKLLAKEDL